MSQDQPTGGPRDPWSAGADPTGQPAPNLPPPSAGGPQAPPGTWSQAPPALDATYGYGQPTVPVRPQNDKGATRALVLGIISLIVCGVILGPAAIYEGYQARTRIRQSGGALTGDGLALAGIILGTIGVIGAIGILIITFGSSGNR